MNQSSPAPRVHAALSPAAPERSEEGPLVATITYTPCTQRHPVDAGTYALWSKPLGIVIRAFFCYGPAWRLNTHDGPPINDALATAWAFLPDGVLPPPDGGVA